ncbi:MAG TPA: cation:proton antiporter [Acidimicrobiia bacterium]|nr:cation:proton antiporter [Acidimicrobiia bacterium]
MSGLAVLAIVFVAYSLVAARLQRWSITAPMVFVLTGALLGPDGLGMLDVSANAETVKIVTELTLALILFADASTLKWKQVRLDSSLPTRLLLIGFPLTILAGTLSAGWLVPGLGWASAALVGSILAPTDAALGLGVFSDRSVPARVRRALNIESGLNDGLATPLVTLFLAIVVAEEGGSTNWLAEAVKGIGVAILAAAVVGIGFGRLIAAADRRGWTSETSNRLAVLATALLAYGGSVAVGGNGFVAAFAAGILFAAASGGKLAEATSFTEHLALFLSFGVWVIFGALFVGPVLNEGLDPVVIVYGVLSLTLVRMVPVAIAMAGTGLRPASTAFMGWFGPRGLASVVFTLIAFETLEGGGLATEMLVEVATWTILLSILAHGLTARPLAAVYGRRVADGVAEQFSPSLTLEEPMPKRRL